MTVADLINDLRQHPLESGVYAKLRVTVDCGGNCTFYPLVNGLYLDDDGEVVLDTTLDEEQEKGVWE